MKVRNFTFCRLAQEHTEPSPMGTWGGSFSHGHEADSLPPTGTKVKITWNYASFPPDIFIAWYFDKNRDNFTLP